MDKQHLSFIDFFDSAQTYLDILSSSADALKYYADIIGNNELYPLANSINFAVFQLKKEFEEYQKVTEKGDNNNGKK